MKNELKTLIDDLKANILYLQSLGIEDLWVREESLAEVPLTSQADEATSLAFTSSRKTEKEEASISEDPIAELIEKTRPSNLRLMGATSLHSETKSNDELDKPKEKQKIEEETAEKKEKKQMASLFDEAGFLGNNDSLEKVRADIGDCKRCPLHAGRTQIVHSVGNPHAKLMFVGEAPGADEDRLGEPFVGKAGQLLTKIIEAIGMKREDVFIGNINRCRPPGNRQPTPEEAKVCREFLIREIFIVRPRCIVALGSTACQYLLSIKTPITKIRGEFQDFYGIKVMPTFHPAYLLRDPSKKREVWEDMKKVRDFLKSFE